MKTFLIIFWVHQAIFGLSSVGAVLNLLLEGGTTNQSNLVPLLLAMSAGSLTWGVRFCHGRTAAVVGEPSLRPKAQALWAQSFASARMQREGLRRTLLSCRSC